ncbi:hypothetical protein P4H70_12310 [Paenibacillus ehimensis]|uniref:hypothetical protein n=1 Tax=Paenibacillus ehimensis TaxID=79264 RepID=UPI002DB5EF4C|nr:hypothetical protein [Paenibacillus ehimensis]MEC0209714.1 hypothetical protein [Paenibacillus ehimensis]
MDFYKQQVKEIQDVSNRYVGGFVTGDNAMSSIIHKILKKRRKEILVLTLINLETNKVLLKMNCHQGNINPF